MKFVRSMRFASAINFIAVQLQKVLILVNFDGSYYANVCLLKLRAMDLRFIKQALKFYLHISLCSFQL